MCTNKLLKKLLALKAPLGRLLSFNTSEPPSAGYEVLSGRVSEDSTASWRRPSVAKRQHSAFVPLIEQMKQGLVRDDFRALALAIEATQVESPEIMEIGCGSGWNWLVLDLLFKKPFEYTGLDCSPAMINIA